MSHKLISSVYSRGDESRAHYTSFKRPEHVLKNKRASKPVRINKWTHIYETTMASKASLS